MECEESGEDVRSLGLTVHVDGRKAVIMEVVARGKLASSVRVKYESGEEELVISTNRIIPIKEPALKPGTGQTSSEHG